MRSIRLPFMFAVCAATLATTEPVARAADCLSMNPADWPPAARPYFLLMVSTSTGMSTPVLGNVPASCTVNGVSYGTDRRAHARCALKTTVETYSPSVNFGLATFARTISGCSDDGDGLCDYDTCTHANLSNDGGGCATGCGPKPTNAVSRTGAFFRVAVPSQPALPPDNLPDLLAWMDGSCADSRELFASGCRPHNGALRDAYRYFSDKWVPPAPVPGGMPLFSPLTSLVQGERACRTIHNLLILDGDESCDTAADAIDAAGDLFTGFVKDGIPWRVKTHVLLFAGNNAQQADAIAAAGGTTSAYVLASDTDLTVALAAIIGAAIVSETCDNADNNCNGCVDEGSVHYCHQNQPCCAWATPAQRITCLKNFESDPDNDPELLPCTTPAQQQVSTTWLCVDPGDACDGVDNNCAMSPDEGCMGSACADGSACKSGFCVDGVCCDAACGDGLTDDCVACSVAAGAASDGACGAVTDGAACEDGDACTQTDTCDAAVCIGSDPVLCSPADECHVAGTCEPQTGACSDPEQPDGTPCSGGACSSGTCIGTTTSEVSSSETSPTSSAHETSATGTTGGTSVSGSGTGGSDLPTEVTAPTGSSGGPGVTGSDSSGGTSTGTGETPGADGCGCTATRAPHGLVLLALAWRRRRRVR